MWTLSVIRWQSAGGYAWTLDYPDGSCTQYHTDRQGCGVWEEGIQVATTDELDLHGLSSRTRRHHVERWHMGSPVRSWIPGGAGRQRDHYMEPPSIL